MRNFHRLPVDLTGAGAQRFQSYAERYVNQELRAALEARAQSPVILTMGFKPIVTP